MADINTITLVVVSDDHYVILLAALIKSIEGNLSAGVKIDLWIVEDGISKESMQKMHTSVNSQITVIHWKNIHAITEGASLPKDKSSFPLNIYARLFIPYFIPENIEKALYLDVDMIVLADLFTLWNIDLSDYILAAVKDPRVQTFDNNWGGVLNYKELGLNGKSTYFNTGMLLMNTHKWREDNIANKVIDVVSKNIKYANYPDQYGLNVVLTDNWLELDAKWNHFVTIEDEAPYIIHFVNRKPIYKAYANSRIYRDYFYKYLNQTQWRGTKEIGESKRRFKKIKNILDKITGRRL